MDAATLLLEAARVFDPNPSAEGGRRGDDRLQAARAEHVRLAAHVLRRVFKVGRWMGHGGDASVRRVYGHKGTVTHRSKVLEYRPEQHTAKLGGRLQALYQLVTPGTICLPLVRQTKRVAQKGGRHKLLQHNRGL